MKHKTILIYNNPTKLNILQSKKNKLNLFRIGSDRLKEMRIILFAILIAVFIALHNVEGILFDFYFIFHLKAKYSNMFLL